MIRQLNVYRKMKGELYESKKRTALLGRVYLIICLIVALFPIYWMINTSFKSDSEIYAKVPTLIPHHPTGAAYSYLINNTNFLSSMKNSLIIAVSVSVFSILIAYPVAYTLSRLKFKGRRIFQSPCYSCICCQLQFYIFRYICWYRKCILQIQSGD